jgi:hypothetical protein
MPGARHFHRDQRREYLRCGRCRLVFVPPSDFLDPAAERAEYERHENDPDDPGYRAFLAAVLRACAFSVLALGNAVAM